MSKLNKTKLNKNVTKNKSVCRNFDVFSSSVAQNVCSNKWDFKVSIFYGDVWKQQKFEILELVFYKLKFLV